MTNKANASPLVTILYGPPGAGKSTRAAGNGLDLEGVFSAFRLPMLAACAATAIAENRPLIVGAADVSVDTARAVLAGHGDAVRHVLLLPQHIIYDTHRAERDRQQPRKAAQGDYYDAFLRARDRFDEVWED